MLDIELFQNRFHNQIRPLKTRLIFAVTDSLQQRRGFLRRHHMLRHLGFLVQANQISRFFKCARENIIQRHIIAVFRKGFSHRGAHGSRSRDYNTLHILRSFHFNLPRFLFVITVLTAFLSSGKYREATFPKSRITPKASCV